MSPTPATRTVSTLLCHTHVPMALDCLSSLMRLCQEPLTLRIHDDGTLTAADSDLLRERLGRIEIIWRAEADERLADEYWHYKNILALRKTLPLALKAFDAVAYSREPTYAYVDSDVLFLRPLKNPFYLSGDGIRALFMQDREASYSLRSWQKLMSSRVSLPSRVNTGLVVADRSVIDFDLMEWFVGKPMHRGIPNMMEQTYWAMLGARVGCKVIDPAQVRVMREGEETSSLVAGHFTARTRHLLPEFVKMSKGADANAEPVVLSTVDAGSCTAWSLLSYEARRAARGLIG